MNVFDLNPTRDRVTILDGEKAIIVLDAALSENHSWRADSTDFPIETGFSISDNIINQPKTYTLEGIVSDDPVDILQEGIESRTIGWAIPDELKSRINSNVLQKRLSRPSLATFQQFEEIFDRRIPVQIQCDLKLYKNMVMVSLDMPRSSQTYRALKFTASFKQITIVDVEYISRPKRLTAFEVNANPLKDSGKQSTAGLEGNEDLNSHFKRFGLWVRQVTGLAPAQPNRATGS